MSCEEVGAYIRLICHQWNRGSIPVQPDKQQRLAGGSVSADVVAKFKLCPDGELRNDRLEFERSKQADFRAKQAEKGRKSGLARSKNHGTTVEPRLNHGLIPVEPTHEPETNSPSPSPSPSVCSLLPVREVPALAQVLAEAGRIGLAEWKAKDWFDEMESVGWKDYQGRDVRKWQPMLARVKTKWEADGRPSSPPKSKAYDNGSSKPNPRNEGCYQSKTDFEEVVRRKELVQKMGRP